MAKLTRLDRQKRDQINSIYAEHSTDKREYYKTFYSICVKNNGNDLDTIFEELNKVLGKNDEINRENISKKLTEMGTLYPDNSNECLYIINLGLSIKNNKMTGIIKYSKLLKEINAKREANKKRAEANKNNRTSNKKEACDEKINELMDKVINDEDLSGYTKEEMYYLLNYARKNMNSVDQDKYIDFIIKYYKLNTYDKEELLNLRDALIFFYDGSMTSAAKIRGLDLDNEQQLDIFNKIEVYGRENLDAAVKKYPNKVKAWELTRLDKFSSLYKDYIKVLDKMIDEKDLSGYKEFTQSDKYTLDTDYSFLKEYVNEFNEIYKCYNTNIKKIYSTSDENIKKMSKKFIDKIIKEK